MHCKAFFLCICCILPDFLIAQDHWYISGTVTDSLENPLTMATVFATQMDSSEKIIIFGNTDPTGVFRLAIPSRLTEARLNIRYLGYQPIRYYCRKTALEYLHLILMPDSTILKEVIITGKSAAIMTNEDTTRYKLAFFRDSSEFNVEDVLNKLPGLRVKENGEILYNGKPIEKVLIEGSDLFGRKYTIGTKNIRADFISEVEVIERYQENPMLKNINLSDATILNLKMSPDKNRILSGTINTGIGGFAPMKGSLHTNLFSITPKNKVILLSDNGNNGQQSAYNEIAATYDPLNTVDVKTNIYNLPSLTDSPNIDNPGLPAPFIIDGISSFSTIRSDFNLKKDWNLHWNVAGQYYSDRQNTSNAQNLTTAQVNYDLTTIQTLQKKKKTLETEANITHFSKNKKLGFQSYVKLDLNTLSFQQLLDQYRTSSRYKYDNKSNLYEKNIWWNNLFSISTGKNSVFQVLTKYQYTDQPQNMQMGNKDFAGFAGADSTYTFLNQENTYRFQGLELSGSYSISLKRAIWKIECRYNHYAARYFLDQHLLNAASNEWSLPDPLENTIKSEAVEAGISLTYPLKAGFSLQGHAELNSRNMDTISLQPLFAPTFDFFLVKQFTHSGKIRFGHRWSRILPDFHNYLSGSYFSNSYVLKNFYQNVPTSGHHFTLHYSHQVPLKYRAYYVFFHYNINKNSYRNNIQFFQSIQALTPYLAAGNQALSGNANFEQFIPKIKTSLSFGLSYHQDKGQDLIAQENTLLTNKIYALRHSIKYNFFRNIIQLNLEGTSLLRYSTFARENVRLTNKSTSTLFQTSIQIKKDNWRFSYHVAINRGKSNIYQSSNYLGSHARFFNDLLLFGKKVSLEAILYNIENTRYYQTISSDPYFNFRSSIEAVPRFFMVKLDMSF